MKALLIGLLLVSSLFAQQQERTAIPQIADGGGWKTRIVLVNRSLTLTATASLHFYDQNGVIWPVPIVGRGLVAGTDVTIPPGGSLILETEAVAPQVMAGWLEILSGAAAQPGGYDPNTNQVLPEVPARAPVLAFVAFRHLVDGYPDYEASVFSLPAQTTDIAFALDNVDGYVTSVAIANTQANPIMVKATFRTPAGEIFYQETFPLVALGHTIFETTNRFVDSKDHRGTVEFSTDAGMLAALCLWFNPNGPFTSIPNLTFE